MNKKLFYKRARGILRPVRLAGKFVIAVGNGSGGSYTCSELGRLGISMLLMDRPGERLEEHNLLRHQCGYRFLGQPKPSALAAHIDELNPSTKITTAECDVVASPEQFEELVMSRRCDLILDCVDDPAAKHLINDTAARHGIPVVGAGVFDGGVGGEVYRVLPDGACYSCIAATLSLSRRATRQPRRVNYDNPDRNEARSTCALNLHIAQIAILQAQVALNALLGEETIPIGVPKQASIITFSNRIVPGVFQRPWHAEFFVARRDPNCLVCGRVGGDVEAEAAKIIQGL